MCFKPDTELDGDPEEDELEESPEEEELELLLEEDCDEELFFRVIGCFLLFVIEDLPLFIW